MHEATSTIDEFIKAMEAIDINAMKNADFYKRRREIRQMLGRVSEALEGGMLNPERIQRYIDALKKSGSGTRQTRQQIKTLQSLLVLSVAAATTEAVDRMEKGEAASEAIARSSVNFVIDLAIAGVPITVAAEMATQIMFTSYAHATGETFRILIRVKQQQG